MQFSGYPKEIRYRVVKKAMERYEEDKKKTDEEGVRFKPSKETKIEKWKRKRTKRSEWSRRRGRYETVMFVEATENAELKNRIEIAAKRNKLKIKVQERSGVKLKRLLQRSDPFSEKKCKRDTCIICKNDLGVNCRTRGCVYQLVCKDCNKQSNKKKKYRGQTGRSMHERTNEHF